MSTPLRIARPAYARVIRAVSELNSRGVSLVAAMKEFGLPDTELSAHAPVAESSGGTPMIWWWSFCSALLDDADENRASLAAWERQCQLRWGVPEAIAWAASTVGDRPPPVGATHQPCDMIDDTQALRDLSQDARTDIPSQILSQNTACVEAGISDVHARILVRESNYEAHDARVRVTIKLPAVNRGAHMSRLQSAIVSASDLTFGSLLEAVSWIGVRVAESQESISVTVSAEQNILIETASAQTGMKSNFASRVAASITLQQSGCRTGSVALTLPIMTACPCTLAYSRLLACEMAGEELGNRLPPGFTHSQPGDLKIMVEGSFGQLPPVAVVLDAAFASAHIRTAVLKRPDEHEFVRRVHEEAQFSEDVARDAACEVACRMTDGNLRVITEARLSESIHPHTAVASVDSTARGLWQQSVGD